MWNVKQNLRIFSRQFLLTTSPKNYDVRSIRVSKVDNTSMAKQPIKSFKEIPGPSSLPLIGPIHHFLPGGKFYNMNRKDMCYELYRLYGPIVKMDKLANQLNAVFLYDAESASKVLRGEERGPQRIGIKLLEVYRQKFNKQYQVGALINSKGSEWQNVRTPANKAMMNPKVVSASYSKVLNEVAMDAVARIQSVRDENNMIPNFDQEIKLWALESTGMVTLGRRLNCFRPDLPEDSYEKRLISLIQKALMYAEIIEYSHGSFAYYTQYKKALNVVAELVRTVEHFVNDAVTKLESKQLADDVDSQTYTIQKIIKENKNAALAVAFDSMIGAVDSVSQTIIFFLYCLGTNPDKREKLREEILSGDDRKSYLRACMKESSRILPTVFANARVTTKQYEILGYEVPAGTHVIIPHGVMCMMESQYPRAQEFIPERWLVEKEHPLYYGNAHPYAHGPFGFGIRSCVGRRIAELTMETFIINMFKTFDIKWEGPPPKVIVSTVNKMEQPFRFILNNLK